jgi:hypothetical protein
MCLFESHRKIPCKSYRNTCILRIEREIARHLEYTLTLNVIGLGQNEWPDHKITPKEFIDEPIVADPPQSFRCTTFVIYQLSGHLSSLGH